MHRLRVFLRICFGYLTLISLVLSIFMVRTFYWMATHPHHYAYTYRGQRNLFLSGSLILLSRFVRLIPFLMAIVYGTAWWTLKHGRRSARAWSIAASILIVLSTAALFTASLLLWPARHHHFGFLLFQIFFFAVGVLGLFVFSRRFSGALNSGAQPRHFQGDGTSAFLDLLVSALALSGVWGGMILYTSWAQAQLLPFTRGAVSWPVILLIIFITVVLHEAAHATVGLALGMKLRAFVIGPFQWRIRDGRWTYRFVPAAFLSFGGSTGIISTNPNQSRWVEISMIAAGPLINLLSAILAALLTLSAKGHSWERFWEPLAFFALVNTVTFAVNLVPFRPEALYSDGARIFQFLSGGKWAELHRVFSIVLSSTVTPLRPRNYDIQAINGAAANFTAGREALMLRLFATSHYLDQNQLPEARACFAEAVSILDDGQINLSSDLLATFVFNTVYLDRDAAAARRYWDLFESSSPTHLGVDYWLARSALHFIENNLLEARNAWDAGAALARKLPTAGAYEFDRDRYRLMRDLLSSPSTADPEPSFSSAKLLRMLPRDPGPQSISSTPGGNISA